MIFYERTYMYACNVTQASPGCKQVVTHSMSVPNNFGPFGLEIRRNRNF